MREQCSKLVFEYLEKHNKIHDELYSLNKKLVTVVAERIADCNEIDVTDPIFEVPRQSTPKY
jgi:hypothetical protein